jgi:ABC-type lipoprotein release transport system permease subunit
MNIWKMAWRNVLRNRRRSAVTIGAMTFALMMELLYAGMIPGFMQGMEDDVVDLEVGDVQVFGGKYLERPSLYEVIEDHDALMAKLDAADYPVAPRLIGGGLAASGQNSAGVAFRGVDIERDKKVSLIHEKVGVGTWLAADDPMGVVIGKCLARTLGTKPGDELVVLAQASDGSMANELFKVRGVLLAVGQATDASTVYLNANTFREMFVFPDGAHKLIVRRPEATELPVAGAFVKDLADKHPHPTTAKTWKEIMPVLGTMMDSAMGLIAIMYLIFYVAVGILLLNAMLMAVFERIREFGVLKAIGTGPAKVFGLIMAESAVQASVALVLGILLALPGMWYLQTYGIDMGGVGGTDMLGVAMRPVWFGVYEPQYLTTPIVMFLFVVFTAVLYPALKASWIRPVEAMHHQ